MITCPTCGRYLLDGLAALAVTQSDFADRRFALSGLARQESDAGGMLELSPENLKPLAESAPVPRTPFEAHDRILSHLLSHTKSLVGLVRLPNTDFPIAFARGPSEFSLLLKQLERLGLIEPGGDGEVRLTLEGWKRAEELRAARPTSRQAFVAMWFAPEVQAAWDHGFKPALEGAGYKPIRIDLVAHNDRIDDRILAEIRLSGLLVADFTGNRGGVYFEAGFALGLGLPVIWTCRADFIQHVHFDTRQYNHVLWSSPEELEQRLRDRIIATLPARPR